MMNMSKNLFTLNPRKFVSNFRVGIQVHYQGREEVRIWGINILENNEKSDGVLIKFLESENFNLSSSMNKIISTVKWREEWEIEELFRRKSGSGFWVSGVDYKDQPVCYVKLSEWCDNNSPLLSICGCWVQLLEKAVRSLSFSEIGGVSTVFRVVDLSKTSKAQMESIFQAFQITQQYYPNIVNDEIYLRGLSSIPRPIRKKSPCVYKVGAHREIFKYIPIAHVPVEYGGIPPIVEDGSYETKAGHIDVSYGSRQDVVFYCYKGTEITLRARVIDWDSVFYGVNFFCESAQKPHCYLNRIYNRPKEAYEEFMIKNREEDGILILSVYSSSIADKKLVYLLSSFPQGSLVEIKIEKEKGKGKGKGKEGLNNLQGLQKKAHLIYNRVKILLPHTGGYFR